MLRIAVTGPVGSGTTTLLRSFGDWARDRGREVNGVLSPADGERHPGADSFTLTYLDGSAPAELAARSPGGDSSYSFADGARVQRRRGQQNSRRKSAPGFCSWTSSAS